MRTAIVLVAGLAMIGLLAGATTVSADECFGLGRWDCNQHPGCTTGGGDPGHCYWTGQTYCWCHALTLAIADVCDVSIELTDGSFDFTYATAAMTNNYTLPAGNPCTGYTANGPDGVANVYLAPGGSIEAHMDPDGTQDSSLYLITDCANPSGTCVAGADDTFSGQEETFTYTSATGGIYYIIFDSWTSAPGPQNVHVWGYVQGSAPTAVEAISWGTIKAMYR